MKSDQWSVVGGQLEMSALTTDHYFFNNQANFSCRSDVKAGAFDAGPAHLEVFRMSTQLSCSIRHHRAAGITHNVSRAGLLPDFPQQWNK